MNIEEQKVTIGFHYIDESGAEMKAEQSVPMYAETERELLFDQFLHFLRYIGMTMDKEFLFEESLTGEEYEFLETKLKEYRENKKEKA